MAIPPRLTRVPPNNRVRNIGNSRQYAEPATQRFFQYTAMVLGMMMLAKSISDILRLIMNIFGLVRRDLVLMTATMVNKLPMRLERMIGIPMAAAAI